MSVDSGTSTPLSTTSTLTCPPSPQFKYYAAELVLKKPFYPASSIIEFIASRSASSSTVYIYDLAEQAGFGILTKSWAGAVDDTSSVVLLQTRAGAGLSLVGRLSEGTSQDTVKGAVLSAYTTPTGLAAMAQSLSYLPSATPTSRLVMQVPRAIPVGETFTLSPTLAPLATLLPILPEIVILLSATPQESVDLTVLSYTLSESHVIHIFDHHSCSREIGHSNSPFFPSSEKIGLSVQEAVKRSGYTFFDYVGDANAHTTVVLLNGPLALTAMALATQIKGFGVVIVRVLRPWDESALRETLPSTVNHVHVFDDVPNGSTQGSLYIDVLSTLVNATFTSPSVHPHRITPTHTQEFIARPAAFSQYLFGLVPYQPTPLTSLDPPNLKKLLFFSTPKSSLSALPHIVQNTFACNQNISSRLLTDHDVFSRPGGITSDRLCLSPRSHEQHLPIPVALPLAHESQGSSVFLGVLDAGLLKSHSILKYANPGSVVLVVTQWSVVELWSNLPSDVTSVIIERQLRMFIFDAKTSASKLVGAEGPAHDVIQNLSVLLAFLRLYIGAAASEALVYKVARTAFEDIVQGVQLTKVNAHAWSGLVEVEFSAPPKAEEPTPSVLKEFEFNAISVETDEGDTVVNGARLGSWHDAAKHLLFPSVFTPPQNDYTSKYSQHPALRPELPERTFLVTCAVNRRLTPLEYDRNVFHLEFDTSGTGLTYAIGEALGVHGWNDEQDVLDFCDWYGVDANDLVTIPVPGKEGQMHTRTVLQVLQQQIDIFGRPPKSFYTDLAAYAMKQIDKFSLLFIGSPEGSATFKMMSEKDTVTFADVLRLYASARPGIEILCEMVGDIKPRHYSIASAQSAVGDRVDLLVVTVEWVTRNGSPRYGQCTRYLAGLKVGQKVTVSIKPSVMKLPPDSTQPIIMAGLGTGAAPFRAFLQHRAWQAQQNIPGGPIYYYFGSRHQSQEYLYGEELEAYILDGTISKAGLAFSRDGPKKVYIQHKMLEDAEALARMLKAENGVFYLCGPTWPVPDVYEALVGALVKFQGQDPETAGAFLEGLKEEERYVLEVY